MECQPRQASDCRRGLWSFIPTLLVSLSTAVALAQAPAPNELPRVELSGTIGKIGRGVIEISADTVREFAGTEKKKAKNEPKAAATENAGEKKTMVVAIQPGTSVRVSGVGTAKVLRAGQYVRFSGKIEEDNRVKSVSNLEVVIPDKSFQPKLDIRVPAPKFASDAPTTKTRDFSVEGRVVGYSRGQLTVQVDTPRPFVVPVPDTTEVSFTSTSYAGAKAGDKILAEGRLVRPGQVVGEMVSITLSAEQPKPKAKTGEKAEPKDFTP
jgi:hypothetical protein